MLEVILDNFAKTYQVGMFLAYLVPRMRVLEQKGLKDFNALILLAISSGNR